MKQVEVQQPGQSWMEDGSQAFPDNIWKPIEETPTCPTTREDAAWQARQRTTEPSTPLRLPVIVGIGRHIFVERIDRGKWQLVMAIQIAGESRRRPAFLGTNIMRLDFTTRDEARDFRDHLLFDLANRTSAVYQVFFRSDGKYPDAEIRNGWASAGFKAADFGNAFKEPKKYETVGIEVKP